MVAFVLLRKEEVGGCEISIREDMPSVCSSDDLRVGKQMDASCIRVVR
jgi:hypothetical protein